jgi:D-serine deaminase-like pyridoxal phosphate-dependent protein
VTAWYEIANANAVESPSLLIYSDRVAKNLAEMIRFAGDPSRLRPHVKTHKLPQIVAMKLAAGITKFKTSTIAEAEMTAAAGGKDILMAYQPVGPGAGRFAQLIKAFPQTRFAALVDNPGTLAELSAAAVAAGVTMELVVDLNVGMNRTGVVPGPDAVALYKSLFQTPAIVAGGLHAYDGHLHNPDHDTVGRSVKQMFDALDVLIAEIQDAGHPAPRIIAGGTPTSPLLVRYPGIEVGAGTTVLWDFGQAATTPYVSCINAAVLMSRVISRPTPDRICLDLGYKSVACESPQPRVRFFGLEDAEIVLQNEEHLVMQTPRAADFPVGTVVYGIPRHICPTVAMHSYVWHVKDGIAVERWPVVARTRRITV